MNGVSMPHVSGRPELRAASTRQNGSTTNFASDRYTLTDKIPMLRAGHTLQLTVVALLGLATIVVHSAGMTIGPIDSSGIIGLPIAWSRHSIYALLAITALIVTSRINIRHILQIRGPYNPVLWFMLASLVLVVLTLVPGVGKTINGACRWLYLGPRQYGLTFQPSELVKWMMVLAIACWCTRRGGAMRTFRFGLAPALGFVGLACGMIMIEDLGTGALIGLVSACLLVAGGARLWQLILMLPFGVAAIAGGIIVSPYRMTRLTTFLGPLGRPIRQRVPRDPIHTGHRTRRTGRQGFGQRHPKIRLPA